jgi:predicted amidohydrolase YtcJ
VPSQDVLWVAPDAICDTKALMTLVDGTIVYRNGI